MEKNRLLRRIDRIVYDKKLCNRTLLRYYKCLKEAADVLEGRCRKEKK